MTAFFAFALPLTLYLSLPSMMWNFDGVACAAALEYGDPTFYFHSQHLLYGFLGWLFWKAIALMAPMMRALPALQLFSSLLSAIGLLGLFQTLRHFSGDRTALLVTLFASVTAVFWVWSLEAQVYPLGFAGLAWANYFLLASPRSNRQAWAGAFHGFALLGHVLTGLWIVPALYWLRKQEASWTSYLGWLALTTGVPYLLVILGVLWPSGKGLAWISIWLKGSTGLTPDRHFAWHFEGWSGPWQWARATLEFFWGSFWPYAVPRATFLMWGLTGISAAAVGWLVVRSWRERQDPLWRYSLIWIFLYGMFLWTWEPSTLCYRMTDVIPWSILLVLGIRTLSSKQTTAVLAALGVSTFALTLDSRTWPMHEARYNVTYTQTLALAKATPEKSLYLTEGGLQWLYILYFTGRSAWNVRAMEPRRLAEELTRQKRLRPVYKVP